MEIGSVMIGMALLVVVAALVLRPVLQPRKTAELPVTEIDALVARRDGVVAALRDLDFDYATEKITEEDFQTQRTVLMAEGVAVLKQLDALGVTSPQATLKSDDLEKAIEQAVAARRSSARAPAAVQTGAAKFCAQCGAVVRVGDKFCSNCGAALDS